MSIQRIITFISDIFFDTTSEQYEYIFLDKTEHYKQELPDCVLDGVFVAARYTGECKNDIEQFKYYRQYDLYRKFIPIFEKLFLIYVQSNDINTCICQVPSHYITKIWRRYDHMKVLSSTLAKVVEVPYFPLLVKKKYTKHQATLDKFDRRNNLVEVFMIWKKYRDTLHWKTIYILDDVISTGSTVNECAKILKKEWAKKVIVFTLASAA